MREAMILFGAGAVVLVACAAVYVAKRQLAAAMVPLFLIYGQYLIRPFYAVFVYLAMAQKLPDSLQLSEPFYIYAATFCCAAIFAGLPLIGIIFGLVAALYSVGWPGMIVVAIMAIVETSLLLLQLRIEDGAKKMQAFH